MSAFFPEPITKLPEADIPLAGLKAYLSQSDRHQVLFMQFEGWLRKEGWWKWNIVNMGLCQIRGNTICCDWNLRRFLQISNGYHKTFQIVEYTMTNIQEISLSKIGGSVPVSLILRCYGFVIQILINPSCELNLKFQYLVWAKRKGINVDSFPSNQIKYGKQVNTTIFSI